ncbi:hypothetical protein BDR26DRAFT_42653 [Obelidium mucronatum]|nr:hypothetical protein BDR26DRAFT_42653 [Obelidium mucronatum]
MGFMMASLKQTLSIVSNTTSSPLSPFEEKESLPVMESSPPDTKEDATLLESLKRTSVSKRKDQSDPVILSPFKQSFTNFLTRSLMTTPRQGLSRSPSNEIESCASSCANEVIESSITCIEGPIFNTTILESSSRAGKNGIPDIVIQCIEYLERKGFLKTEGLYRVPGNIKRIKEIYNLFQDYYHRHHRRGSGLLRSSNANSRRNSITSARSSSSAGLVDPDATLQPRSLH